MTAPSSVTMRDLTGDWIVNKDLSDDIDPLLKLQGVNWLLRRAIAWSTVTLHIKQYVEDKTTHIDIDLTGSGGIKGTSELRPLDWTFREHANHVFGTVKDKTRWVHLADIDDPFLQEGWCSGDEEEAGPEGQKLLQCWGENNDRGWTVNQVWGFGMVLGNRRHVRRIVVAKDDTVVKIRLVYDWQGKK